MLPIKFSIREQRLLTTNHMPLLQVLLLLLLRHPSTSCPHHPHPRLSLLHLAPESWGVNQSVAGCLGDSLTRHPPHPPPHTPYPSFPPPGSASIHPCMSVKSVGHLDWLSPAALIHAYARACLSVWMFGNNIPENFFFFINPDEIAIMSSRNQSKWMFTWNKQSQKTWWLFVRMDRNKLIIKRCY